MESVRIAQDEPLPVVVYTPESLLARPGKLLVEMVRDLARSRELAWRLAVRDIQGQYRQALLGLFWAFLSPLVTSVTWIFLRRSGVVTVADTGLPYPVYVFSGTILWSILVEALNMPLAQTSAATRMLAKLDFPREAIVVSGLYQVLFNSAIKVVLLTGGLLVLGVRPGAAVLLFPLGVLSLVLVGVAIGLFLTPVGMLYTDVRRAVPLVMGLGLYLTPVVFPLPAGGWTRAVYELNPFSPLIQTARAWLTGTAPETLAYFATVNAAAFALLLLSWVGYRLAMPILIERLSA